MNEQELDELFREAAAQHTPSAGKEEVWKKLEQKLDAAPVGGKDRRRRWGYLSILAILLLGLATWQLFPDLKNGTHTAAPANLPAPKTAAVPATPSPEADKPQFPYAVNPADQNTSVSSASKKAGATGLLPKPRPTAPTGSTPVAGVVVSRPKAPLSGTEKQPSTGLTLSGRIPGEAGMLSMLPSVEIRVPGLELGESAGTLHLPKDKMKSITTADLAPSPTDQKTLPGDDDRSPDGRKHKSSVSTKSHWFLGLTLGPDWSSAAARGWGTGISGGLKLGYRLNDKWAVSTGVLLDKKIYDALPGDYNPPDNGWRNYDVKVINANCTVIDVPLNLSYTVWQHANSRITLSTGLSSFWMREEKYTYNYKTSAGAWDDWTKEMYGKNQNLFSILNISPGYEKSWRHLSIEVAPYIKIPLNGIGYGRVKLYSTGIHFTLSYGLK